MYISPLLSRRAAQPLPAAMKLMMIAALWMVLVAAAGVDRVLAQSQSDGFINIDCGMAANTSYKNATTGLTYTSDENYVDTGVIRDVASAYKNQVLVQNYRPYQNVRSFPNGTRNCYSFWSLDSNTTYLVRAGFYYGNYDGSNSLPSFQLYLGVNWWADVTIYDATIPLTFEIMALVPDGYLQVCFINTGHGTPFVSLLELRPMEAKLYAFTNANQSLSLASRSTPGPSEIRYPDDKIDRIWEASASWAVGAQILSTNSAVQSLYDLPGSPYQDNFGPPSAAMQHAATINGTFNFSFQPVSGQPNSFLFVLYFAELQNSSVQRQQLITFTGYKDVSYTLPYLKALTQYYDPSGQSSYNFTLEAVANTTLGPILNALEVYFVLPVTTKATGSGNVMAMAKIKANYQIKRNWNGDPCSPQSYSWDGLNCSYSSSAPTITSLNLSSSGLTGTITPSFSALNSLKYLDLSHNNLSGGIPDVLANMASLAFLDLSNNSLSGSIPQGLLQMAQSGKLSLRYAGNPALCQGNSTCEITKTNSIPTVAIAAAAAGAVLIILVAIVAVFLIRRRKKARLDRRSTAAADPHHGDGSIIMQHRRYSYNDLKQITNNFNREIGKGGFGSVFVGSLERGNMVAVKMRSQASSQGIKEFLAEAQNLTRIHHKNLVAFFGYCMEGEYLGLIYEFMSEGTLQDHLRGKIAVDRPLTWMQRLRIALDSAQGLEYLHNSCTPPLIHRDVKSANILLTEGLDGKIADFGLSKAFDFEKNTHVSTAVVGTPGYLDPEYYMSYQLTEKSDVYSFGVVLLEIVTGQSPIIPGPKATYIVPWVQQRLTRGDIESVVDPNMPEGYDVNSVWKVTEVALRCTEQSSVERPTMSSVTALLRECLQLATGDAVYSGTYGGGRDAYSDYDSQQGMLEVMPLDVAGLPYGIGAR